MPLNNRHGYRWVFRVGDHHHRAIIEKAHGLPRVFAFFHEVDTEAITYGSIFL